MRLFLISIFLLAFVTPASAQDYKTLLDIPQGATLVNLSATESVEVEQDLLVATLRFEAKDKNPRALQDKINTVMEKALAAAKKVDSVKASTQQYHVYERDQNQGKKNMPRDMIWYGQQGLMVKGKKADDLLELVGKMQDMGLSMNGLNYQVSPELLENTRESLLEAALMKLKSKADRTAKAIGKKETDFKQINVDMGGYFPPPSPRYEVAEMSMAAKDMAAPVAAPGENQVNLTVSAQVLLKD